MASFRTLLYKGLYDCVSLKSPLGRAKIYHCFMSLWGLTNLYRIFYCLTDATDAFGTLPAIPVMLFLRGVFLAMVAISRTSQRWWKMNAPKISLPSMADGVGRQVTQLPWLSFGVYSEHCLLGLPNRIELLSPTAWSTLLIVFFPSPPVSSSITYWYFQGSSSKWTTST